MRVALSLFLITLVLAQPLSKVAVIVRFQWQKEYIVENLCVNRQNPSAHCDGKCYLARQLRGEAAQTPALPGFVKTTTEVTYFFEPAEAVAYPMLPAQRIDGGLPVDIAIDEGEGQEIFHPPGKIV